MKGKCLLGRCVFKGEMLSLLGVQIRKTEADKMFAQRRGVEFVKERNVCKIDV